MFRREKHTIAAFVLSFIVCTLCFISITPAQDETDDAKIIERYKLMLSRKPKEGSTFDRLYQFYLEGAGLDTMVSRLSGRSQQAKPDNPNCPTYPWDTSTNALERTPRQSKHINVLLHFLQTITIHISHSDTYIRHYGSMKQAINALTKAAALSEQTASATPDDRTCDL